MSDRITPAWCIAMAHLEDGHEVGAGANRQADDMGGSSMTDEQIKHMASRFCAWPIPESINPDGGISVEWVRNAGTPYEHKNRISGTNFLSYTEAEQMVRFMLEGLPEA